MYSFTPEQIVSLLGHDTTITVKSSKTPIKGFLYTIDPNTNNIVLYSPTHQRVQIVMNHDIAQVQSKIHIHTRIFFFSNNKKQLIMKTRWM